MTAVGHPAQTGQEKLDGVLECVKQACAVGGADFIEINESCPNVAHGGHGDSSELEARLTAVLKTRDTAAGTGKKVPVLVKLGTLGADPANTCRLMVRSDRSPGQFSGELSVAFPLIFPADYRRLIVDLPLPLG